MYFAKNKLEIKGAKISGKLVPQPCYFEKCWQLSDGTTNAY